MKMFKLFAWLYIVYGVLEIFLLASGKITEFENEMRSKYRADTLRECMVEFMPMWKHWFIAATGIIGGLTMIYFRKKLETEMKDESSFIRLFKEGNLFSIFFICMGIQMLVVGWNSLSFGGDKIICSVVILIGMGWNFLCRYLLAKESKNK